MKSNYTHTCKRCGQPGIPNAEKKAHRCDMVGRQLQYDYGRGQKRNIGLPWFVRRSHPVT